MLKIQGKDFSTIMTDKQLKLVRTYKGDIERTQSGKISAFPTSFITVGFSFSFVGNRADVDFLQQLCLSADLLELQFDYEGTNLKGAFSVTNVETSEVRDKQERSLSLNLSVVSDGTNITDTNGNLFQIKLGDTVVKSGCSFGKVYTFAQLTDGAYYLNGAKLPLSAVNSNNVSVLVLGPVNLSSSAT